MRTKRPKSVTALALLLTLTGLWAPGPQTPAAVHAADPPQVARQGAWLDALLFSSQSDPSEAVTQLQADELDLYAAALNDPDLYHVILGDTDLAYTTSYGSYTEITANPVPFFDDGRINPFGVAAFREAMNMLVDRSYLAREIVGGLGVPKFTPLPWAFPDYARYADVIHDIEATYGYNPAAAEQIIADVMLGMGATLGDDGKWQHNGSPVILIGIIRTEDERKEYGDYVGQQLESAGFTVHFQYKTRSEAWPIWHESDPAEGLWSWYTGGWDITSSISRDDGDKFGYFYTPLGGESPLWQAYTPSAEFMAVADKLWNKDFAGMQERDQLFEQALHLCMQDSVRIWLVDDISFAPRRAEAVVASDKAGNVPGAEMFPYVARLEGVEGGSMRIAQPDLLTEPWNPIAGSNWIYDQFPIRATQDYGVIADPNTGLYWPQRIESADCVVKAGLPVTKTLDWVSLSFAPTVDVPPGAWADWDAATQTFIQAGDMPTPTLEAKAKCTVTYPAELFSTVTWHDGSPLDASDFVMRMIMAFDRAKTESAIYDESAVAAYDDFVSHFRGVVIDSTDPLVITTYDDRWALDAESLVNTWWPSYATGPSAWHNLTPAIRAEEAGELAFSAQKAGQIGVEWMSFVAGPALSIMADWMNQSAGEDYIPYEPAMGAYVTTPEAHARWASLQTWYTYWDHFWLGTGPFYVASAHPVEKGLVLQRYPGFPDAAGRWDDFAFSYKPQVEINYPSGAPGSYFNVNGSGFPPGDIAVVVVNETILGQVAVDDGGAVAFTLSTDGADPGLYLLRVIAGAGAELRFALDEAEPVHPREGELPLIEVPGSLAWTKIYVDAEATGDNTGLSWEDALTDLQDALASAVHGVAIWVAAGTYKPSFESSPDDPRSATFQLKNGVVLYGGFDPTVGDTGWEDRDWVNNVTVLSGDIGAVGDTGDNSYHVFYHPEELALDDSAVLDGFTVSGGNGSDGGGMYNASSSPTLVNCTFSGNSASLGAGMLNAGSSPTVINCTFAGNSAINGGGMRNNSSSPLISNCIFLGNSANIGGGMYNESSSPVVTSGTFLGNSAVSGGAMFNDSSSPVLTNCTFSGNLADWDGGGLFNIGSSLAVTNCTFSGNSADNGGAIHNADSSLTVTNSVLWGDSPDEIVGMPASVTYSDIQGGYEGIGNINLDPLFVDPASGDYHLGLGSPCIDAGTNDAPNLPGYDFEGDPRVMDGNRDGTAIVDMGIDEVYGYAIYLPLIFRSY